MSEINFIITKKEDLKSLIYQWLDEHPQFIVKPEDIRAEMESELKGPMNRLEIAAYLRVSPVTITDWMKKGLPYRRMHGRVFFLKDEVMEAMPSFNHRKNIFSK